jgi:hypothetical protein
MRGNVHPCVPRLPLCRDSFFSQSFPVLVRADTDIQPSFTVIQLFLHQKIDARQYDVSGG